MRNKKLYVTPKTTMVQVETEGSGFMAASYVEKKEFTVEIESYELEQNGWFSGRQSIDFDW